MQKIEQMQEKILKLYNDRLGKNFLNKKPLSVVLFQKRLKSYLFSPESKFLENFPSVQKKLRNEFNKVDITSFNNKIDLGSMIYYSLNDKKNKKDEFFNDDNKEKYLEKSKNFCSVPTKDIINSQFYKVKYQQKNAKRIGKILINKLILNDLSLSQNKSNESDNKVEDFNNYIKYEKDIVDHKQIINIKSEDKKDKSNNSINNANDSSFIANSPSYENKNIFRDNSRQISNKTAYNSFNKLCLNNLTERKNPPYKNNTIKNILSYKELDSSRKKSKNNNIINVEFSPINKTLTCPNRKKLSCFWQTNPNINMHKKSVKKNLFKKLTETSKIYFFRNKNKSKKVINIDFIKKKSLSYKNNIENNIDSLNQYTQTCNSQLLKLVKNNQIKEKKYLQTNKNDEDKEMKDLLSYKLNKKANNAYIKKKLKEEKLKKIKIITNDTIIDYNINKLLKEKTNYDKIKRNNDIVKRLNLFAENMVFDEEDIKEHKMDNQLSNRDKNRRINKYKNIREIIEKNYMTIKRLKNYIEMDKDKLIKYCDKKAKEKNESL